jgi:hypothetical protein
LVEPLTSSWLSADLHASAMKEIDHTEAVASVLSR